MLDSPKAISPFWFISTYHLWRPSQAGCSGQQQRQRKRAWQLWKKAITHIIATIYIRVSHSVMSKSLWSHWLWPSRFLCLWNSAGKNTGVGSHSLLQRIFQIQGSNPGLPYYRWILYHLGYHRSPNVCNGLTHDWLQCDPSSQNTWTTETYLSVTCLQGIAEVITAHGRAPCLYGKNRHY